MVKTCTLERDKHVHWKEPPAGIDPDVRLTLDEFLLFDKNIKTLVYSHLGAQPKGIRVEEACQYFRKKHHARPARFSICISSHERLNELIPLPKIIRQKSLYENCWPAKHLSNYFRHCNKIFYAYSDGHKTPPNIAYGGATEWLYIYSGSLEVELIQPTDLNLHRYWASLEDDFKEIDFKPALNTVTKLKVSSNNFLMIPAGWISIKTALKATFVYGGEMLHAENITCQMESFESDVIRQLWKKTSRDNDAEIRHIYWFYAAHLYSNSIKLDESNLRSLRAYLMEWRTRMRKIEAHCYMSPDLYAPFGIELDLILRHLRRLAGPRVSSIAK